MNEAACFFLYVQVKERTDMPVTQGKPTGGRNPWVEHVQHYRSTHKCSFGEALKGARATYEASNTKRVSHAVYGTSAPIETNTKSWLDYVKGGTQISTSRANTNVSGIWKKFKKLFNVQGDPPRLIYIAKGGGPAKFLQEGILLRDHVYYVTFHGRDGVMQITDSYNSSSFDEARRLYGS